MKKEVITIEQLKKENKVDVYHGRQFVNNTTGEIVVMSRRDMGKQSEDFQKNHTLLSHGGFTLVEYVKDGKTFRGKYNVSKTHQFHRKLGLIAAVGRALKSNK